MDDSLAGVKVEHDAIWALVAPSRGFLRLDFDDIPLAADSSPSVAARPQLLSMPRGDAWKIRCSWIGESGARMARRGSRARPERAPAASGLIGRASRPTAEGASPHRTLKMWACDPASRARLQSSERERAGSARACGPGLSNGRARPATAIAAVGAQPPVDVRSQAPLLQPCGACSKPFHFGIVANARRGAGNVPKPAVDCCIRARIRLRASFCTLTRKRV